MFVCLKKPLIFNLLLLIGCGIYYSLFFNKGLVLSDEGYTAHAAERIVKGQMPYKDFFLQYPPLYFYLIAFFFKIFGQSLIVGRLTSLGICLGIILAALQILKEFGLNSLKSKISTALILCAFGYPLINIPVVVWPTVLITETIIIFILKWSKKSRIRYLVGVGMCLALQILIKQNIALVEVLIVNLIMIFLLQKKDLLSFINKLVIMNSVWIIPTTIWLNLIISAAGTSFIGDFLAFNIRYVEMYPLSYPPLSLIIQPTGIFKLLPYYLPIILLIYFLIVIFKKTTPKISSIIFLPLAGFFTTIYPTTDLLHVYPYLGVIIICFYIFIELNIIKFYKLGHLVIYILIPTGLYLTLIRGYYRYELPFRYQNTLLDLPKSQGIYADETRAKDIKIIYDFIQSHTEKNDYIFVYPFSPALYFLLDRQNPSYYYIYWPMHLTKSGEERVINEVQAKYTKYIITDSRYQFDTPISEWVQKQQKVDLPDLSPRFAVFRI